MQTVKQPPRAKKPPQVIDTLATQISSIAVSEVAETIATDINNSKIWVNPEYNEDSPLFNPEKTLKEWCDIKGITIQELANYDADKDIIKESSNGSITRTRSVVSANADTLCVIALGDYIKYIKGKCDFISQKRLYFDKVTGEQKDKDGPGTSYYSELFATAENKDKAIAFIKSAITNKDRIEWS